MANQHTPRRTPIAVAIAVTAMLSGPAAFAGGDKEEGGGGALSKVVGGIRERTGQQPAPAGAPSPQHGDNLNDPPPRHDHQSGLVIQPYWGYDQRYVAAPYPTYVQGGAVSLYAGIQSVADSDQSVSFALHSSYADWGVAIDDTRYFETNRTSAGMETIHLDVWSASVTHRVAQLGDDKTTAVWVRGGLAGASADDLMVLGIAGTVEIAHNASSQVGVDASLRGLALEDGIRGLEARGGVAASVLRVGYRVLKLDVGPALHGPELGLAWHF